MRFRFVRNNQNRPFSVIVCISVAKLLLFSELCNHYARDARKNALFTPQNTVRKEPHYLTKRETLPKKGLSLIVATVGAV